MKINPATLIDGYKVDHRRQYPEGTELIFSNLTARKTRRPNNSQLVFFGLQYFIKRYLISEWNKNFFNEDIEKIVAKFNRRINNYLGPNQVGDQHIRDLHALGYLPIMIMSLPEGAKHNYRVPSFVIFSTDDKFGWLTNYLETILSTSIWLMCTSATTAHQYKKVLKRFAKITIGDDSFVQWQGHDFSFRGMAGLEAACMSGAAHLISFTGTDTIPAIDFLEEYYNADCEKELIGGSVAATEHSVMCAGGANDEIGTYKRLINEIYPNGIVSIVSDTWDYWNVLTNTARELKDDIMKRDGKVVFRPDTGNPVDIVCGYTVFEIRRDWSNEELVNVVKMGANAVKIHDNKKDYFYEVIFQENEYKLGKELSEPEIKGSIECLWEIFGGTISERGYKVLDSHVGLIYGDSITLERARAICEGLAAKGFASTNIVFGIGSYTYQYVTRDTDGFAVKATYAKINGEDKEIFKNPKTDDGTKKSAKGLTAVFKDENGEYYLKDQATWEEVMNCELKPVFKDGVLLLDHKLSEIRARLAQYE